MYSTIGRAFHFFFFCCGHRSTPLTQRIGWLSAATCAAVSSMEARLFGGVPVLPLQLRRGPERPRLFFRTPRLRCLSRAFQPRYPPFSFANADSADSSLKNPPHRIPSHPIPSLEKCKAAVQRYRSKRGRPLVATVSLFSTFPAYFPLLSPFPPSDL